MNSTTEIERELEVTLDQLLEIGTLKPSPENDKLYRPVDPNDPEIRRLAASIAERGVLEPLVVTADLFVVSGHRRLAAAKLAGLAVVPCRIEDFNREDDTDRFAVLLREHNRQRDKTLDEKLREEIVSVEPEAAYERLQEQRANESAIDAAPMKVVGSVHRRKITSAKMPLVSAVKKVLEDRRKFWPLSVRMVFYRLLNDPPLRHASKQDSVLVNDGKSYSAVIDIMTRGRLAGVFPFAAIADATRPVALWDTHDDARSFMAEQLAEMFTGYWRNLQQSQPNHMEIVGEKNTVDPIIRPIAGEYCIPFTTGRGYCSLEPRRQIAERFRKSGKDKLVLLILSDFDPDGEEIAQSMARSMRDDFGIENIHPVKVALTAEQATWFELTANMSAKKTSSNFRKFVKLHGANVWELEALEPETLQELLREAIQEVLNIDVFNAEIAAEKKDAAFLEGVRKTMLEFTKGMDFLELGT